MKSFSARLPNLILFLLLLLGAILRLIDITDPPLDFHSTRQLRNTIVARSIYYGLLPSASERQRELSASFKGAVGQYEPPIIESLVAVSYFLAGGENFAAPRVWETFFWLLAGLALFDLARRALSSSWAALIGLAYYLALPFAVQASRSFQPDPLMTSALIVGVYFLYRWSESQTWKHAILAGAALSFAVLVKIVIVFLVGAVAVALVLFTLRRDFWKSSQIWAMSFLMILPALTYYVILRPGRSTEYFFAWTVALVNLIASAEFYSKWLAFIGSLFGLTIIFLSIAGALVAPPRLRAVLIGLWAGYVLYGLVLPFQMYTHSYYHIQLIPVVALGLASALSPLIERASAQSRVGRAAFVALIVAVVGYQSWVARSVLIAENYRHEPAFWKSVGEAIPVDAKVIGLTQDYGYRLMVWGWRKVSLWPYETGLSNVKNADRDLAAEFLEITKGDDYFLVTAFGQLEKQPELKKILEAYPIAAQGDGYVLYDLRK